MRKITVTIFLLLATVVSLFVGCTGGHDAKVKISLDKDEVLLHSSVDYIEYRLENNTDSGFFANTKQKGIKVNGCSGASTDIIISDPIGTPWDQKFMSTFAVADGAELKGVEGAEDYIFVEIRYNSVYYNTPSFFEECKEVSYFGGTLTMTWDVHGELNAGDGPTIAQWPGLPQYNDHTIVIWIEKGSFKGTIKNVVLYMDDVD